MAEESEQWDASRVRDQSREREGDKARA